ncbi:Iodothyronine deiodinase [Pirellula sp. SH-Sr6A]|uniref:deiodinase family protein n=1 Tax=Pirellula sp. SH-Sr6A TaxID=1632865 RepID=UPI00078E8904|nr:deiodinase family protein [Pirellula sp. SH-Sr6A]AMV35398.1 Iodothyronine deiodinase [Pirellula sp. SH-Sr6A]
MKYLRFVLVAVFFFVGAMQASLGQVPSKPWFNQDFSSLERECLSVSDDDEACKRLADRIEKSIEGKPTEALAMLLGILRDDAMGIGNGWFKDPQLLHSWSWLAGRFRIDESMALEKKGFVGDPFLFDRIDRNGDGKLESGDFDWSPDSMYMREMGVANQFFRFIDQSGDSQVNRDEWMAFFDSARKDETHLSIDSFRRAIPIGKGRPPYLPGDEPTRRRLLEGFFKSELGSFFEGPSLNEVAPDFELKTQDGKETIRLSKHYHDKPIVLIFGNYTCGPFRRFYRELDDVCHSLKGRIHCFGIYVREAHPEDGWIMESNSRMGVRLPQPKTFEERIAVAQTCATKLNYRMPLLVDSIDDTVGNQYSAMPGRVYVLDRNGRVLYRSSRGPFGFRPGEVEQAIMMSVLDNEAKQQPFVPLLSDQQTWERLPELKAGVKGALPIWARAVAAELPRTTAAMLELDAAHRLRSPLDPKLRAKLRWCIAQANHCDYSMAYALADLRRSGGKQEDIGAFMQGFPAGSKPEQEAMQFVKQLSTEASKIDDDLFDRLKEHYGDRAVAAMVLLAAYGNFQDRIILGLNLSIEENGPLPPCDVRFVDGALQIAPLLPPDNGQDQYIADGVAISPPGKDWNGITFGQLQKGLEVQRDRKARLPIPAWDQVQDKLPAPMSSKPTAIRWSLINYGYVPELAIPWTISTRTHWSECPSPRILEESLFWVQTRAVECSYCMGHCEMLLEVAGLSKEATANRTKLLAESDWSAFPPEEQRAYAFARKLSTTPWLISQQDYQTLRSDWGDKKAMGIFWWLCRGLYMTRISDGFQLPLERENVFGP